MKARPTHTSGSRTLALAFCGVGLAFSSGRSQEEVDNFSRATPPELPEAVADASVRAEVTVPQGRDGTFLTIRRIDPPVLSPPRVILEAAEEQVVSEPEESLEGRLFLPSIEIFPGGLSRIRWHALDARGAGQEYEAWVALDLTSIPACAEFQTGRTVYHVMAGIVPATKGTEEQIPAAEELDDGFRLTMGDPADSEALEPVLALIRLYAQEGEDIVSDYAEMMATQAAREKWEREHPEPVRNTEIRLWPVQSTQYPTKAR